MTPTSTVSHMWRVAVVAGLALAGCGTDTTTTPIGDIGGISVDEDAARTIAGEVGENTGGVIDQLGDVMEAASSMDFGSLRATADGPGLGEVIRSAVYDDVAGMWTITISRERGLPTGTHYAFIERVYEIQYVSPAGEPQKFYTTDDVIASTINFDITSGSGEYHKPYFEQELTNLEGSFVATNTDTDTITINGTYARAASSVVMSRDAERTMDHTVDFTITDLTGPRGLRQHWASAISGTIEGSFHADITWVRGDAYAERSIDREVTIVIENGGMDITMSTSSTSSSDVGHFQGDVSSGELAGR